MIRCKGERRYGKEEQNQHLMGNKLYKNSNTHGLISHPIQVSWESQPARRVYTVDCSIYQQSEQLRLIAMIIQAAFAEINFE